MPIGVAEIPRADSVSAFTSRARMQFTIYIRQHARTQREHVASRWHRKRVH